MKRTMIAALALTTALPAMAADYLAQPALRPAYNADNYETPLQFEAGIRYWYSLGHQEHNIGTYNQTIDTKTSSGEVFGRVEDHSTQTFAEAFGGYGVAHGGSYSTSGGAVRDLPAARLGYVGLDYGWLPWSNENGGVGFITGYQYTNDSPDTGRANFYVTPTATGNTLGGGQDSQINNFELHTLKLGLAGKADFGGFDLQGEAAAIPYSWLTGTYGAFGITGSNSFGQASAVALDGHGYGATGKLMVGIHPTENLTIRFGGRASYLSGQYDASFNTVTANAGATSSQRVISRNNPFTLIRYGALFEVAGRF